MIIFETVVLPEPDSPTRPSVSPVFRTSDTSETACTTRGFCQNRPDRRVKLLVTPSTWRRGPSSGARSLRRRDLGPRRADRGQPLVRRHVEARHGPEERLEIGVAGGAHHRIARPGLDERAAIQHRHVVGDVGDHAEIVGDQQDRHAGLLLEPGQQGEDLGLGGDVERRGRLVGDQQGGLEDQRHGDHGALAQAARQLERVGPEGAARVREADAGERLLRPRIGLPPVGAGVDAQGLADLVADRVQRRQAGHRLLEDHRDALPADRPHRRALGGQSCDVGLRGRRPGTGSARW